MWREGASPRLLQTLSRRPRNASEHAVERALPRRPRSSASFPVRPRIGRPRGRPDRGGPRRISARPRGPARPRPRRDPVVRRPAHEGRRLRDVALERRRHRPDAIEHPPVPLPRSGDPRADLPQRRAVSGARRSHRPARGRPPAGQSLQRPADRAHRPQRPRPRRRGPVARAAERRRPARADRAGGAPHRLHHRLHRRARPRARREHPRPGSGERQHRRERGRAHRRGDAGLRLRRGRHDGTARPADGAAHRDGDRAGRRPDRSHPRADPDDARRADPAPLRAPRDRGSDPGRHARLPRDLDEPHARGGGRPHRRAVAPAERGDPRVGPHGRRAGHARAGGPGHGARPARSLRLRGSSPATRRQRRRAGRGDRADAGRAADPGDRGRRRGDAVHGGGVEPADRRGHRAGDRRPRRGDLTRARSQPHRAEGEDGRGPHRARRPDGERRRDGHRRGDAGERRPALDERRGDRPGSDVVRADAGARATPASAGRSISASARSPR